MVGRPFENSVLDQFLAAIFVDEKYRYLGWGSSLVQLAARMAKAEGAGSLVCPRRIRGDCTVEHSFSGTSLFERALGTKKVTLPDGGWQLALGSSFPYDYFEDILRSDWMNLK